MQKSLSALTDDAQIQCRARCRQKHRQKRKPPAAGTHRVGEDRARRDKAEQKVSRRVRAEGAPHEAEKIVHRPEQQAPCEGSGEGERLPRDRGLHQPKSRDQKLPVGAASS